MEMILIIGNQRLRSWVIPDKHLEMLKQRSLQNMPILKNFVKKVYG